jgi:hypothetical protein
VSLLGKAQTVDPYAHLHYRARSVLLYRTATMAQASSEKSSGTTSRVTILSDPDWGFKGDAEASGREASASSAVPRHRDSQEHDLDISPVEELKQRLSMWGESAADNLDRDMEEEGSEYELLLDPNLPDEYNVKLRDTERDSASYDDEAALKRAIEDQEESPYEDVRVAVRNYDEDMPCNTVRAWTIGLTLVFLGASMNTLFSLRQPSIRLGALVAQVITWPLGHAWAKVMPAWKFKTLGVEWSLNPGPFNIKEHSIIVVMAGVSFSVAYATDIILAQIVFYKQDFGILFQLLLTVSSQSLGYGIAGIMRKFLGTPEPPFIYIPFLNAAAG